MISKYFFANEDLTGWWVVYRATHYIAKMKIDMAQMKELTQESWKIYMKNYTYIDIIDIEIHQLSKGNNYLVK